MHKILFYNKFIICFYMFRALCPHHQEVKIVLHMCDDTTCCIIQFDLLMMNTYCSKHVEAYNKFIIKQNFVH